MGQVMSMVEAVLSSVGIDEVSDDKLQEIRRNVMNKLLKEGYIELTGKSQNVDNYKLSLQAILRDDKFSY